VILLAVEALALVAITALLSATDALSFGAAVLVAAAMALINAILWPIVIRLTLPLTIITFGLGSLALSAGTSNCA
jgi:putative membrane protein